ncbi:MAG TPA: hypothetical protein VG318_09625 [Actinomycetota bacterium]|nr:hypothetical protein [Actinomycetota bacterium]
MRRRLISVTLMAATLVVALAAPAFAVKEQDPADSGLSLDISLIKFVEDPEDVATLTIRTHSAWKCRELRPAAKTSLKWLFDGSGNNKWDLVGSFVCRDGALIFELRSKDGSNQYEPIAAKRPNKRTATVTMPLDLAELDGQHLDLVARSKDLSGETCIEDCVDRAPNKGRMRAY